MILAFRLSISFFIALCHWSDWADFRASVIVSGTWISPGKGTDLSLSSTLGYSAVSGASAEGAKYTISAVLAYASISAGLCDTANTAFSF